MSIDQFRCYRVTKEGDSAQGKLDKCAASELPEGEVTIEVSYSSLNYKDALAATGHPGVVRNFPHVPGIDASGVVVESSVPNLQNGDPVLVTGYEMGSGQWGGWSEYLRVPAEWVIPLPDDLTLESSMQLGTAGLTAALSVDALQHHGIKPEQGPILVTGATGGVGILAVKILAKSGYEVVAVTGKSDRVDWLKEQGASKVIGRDEVNDDSSRPLLKSQWAGAVDCVGGQPLTTILRSTQLGGCVTACGMVAGADLNMSVFPFILRGVTLVGIDSAWCPRDKRAALWRRFAGDWALNDLDSLSAIVTLNGVDQAVADILKGNIVGRTVVRVR